MGKFTFSRPALERLTAEQIDALLRIGERSSAHIEVFTDFSLPSDYVAFSTGTIYGGIDAEGRVST